VVELAGLRNPCAQIEGLASGLMATTLARAPCGELVRKAGVMAIVILGGTVRPGDPIAIELPRPPLRALAPV
jgi:MOSC domain-containing protein YiiM